MRTIGIASLALIAAFTLGGAIGRTTAASPSSIARPKPIKIEVVGPPKQDYIKSLAYTFVSKPVGQLRNGEAGWTTPWSIDGTTKKAYAVRWLNLEKHGLSDTLFMLVGKKNGRYQAIHFSSTCNRSDETKPTGYRPNEPSVLVDYIEKLIPCAAQPPPAT